MWVRFREPTNPTKPSSEDPTRSQGVMENHPANPVEPIMCRGKRAMAEKPAKENGILRSEEIQEQMRKKRLDVVQS